MSLSMNAPPGARAPPPPRGPPRPPPAAPCRQRQYYYRKRKGHHLQRFRGPPGLQAEREVEERAEEERAGARPQRIPGGKDSDGDGDPPQAVGHPLGPGRPVGHREEAAAHPRQRAAEDDGQVTYQRAEPAPQRARPPPPPARRPEEEAAKPRRRAPPPPGGPPPPGPPRGGGAPGGWNRRAG